MTLYNVIGAITQYAIATIATEDDEKLLAILETLKPDHITEYVDHRVRFEEWDKNDDGSYVFAEVEDE